MTKRVHLEIAVAERSKASDEDEPMTAADHAKAVAMDVAGALVPAGGCRRRRGES